MQSLGSAFEAEIICLPFIHVGPTEEVAPAFSDGGPFVNSLIKRAVTVVVPSPVVIGSSPWSASMCGKRESIEIKHMEISTD